MTIYNEQPAPISRQLVPEDQRLAVIERLFGVHFPLRLEPVVYSIAGKMTQEAYSGGYWQFYILDVGTPDKGFYMAPEGDQTYQICCDNNYWKSKLSADALGITACLYAFSHLSFSADIHFARVCADHYHRLRQYMMDHAEVAAILGAID